jgi:two-component system OmpR family response regulator
MKVLVVDHRRFFPSVRPALLAEGFAVDRASDAAAGLSAAASRQYDVIVLNVDPSTGTGYDMLRELRARRIQTPVLMLDARDSENPMTDTFHLAMPDYVSRPASFVAVLARLWGLVRERPDPSERMLTVGSLVLDPVRRVVERSGVVIRLSAREYGLLMFLMRHAGDVVSKTQILEEVWNSTRGGDNLVEVYIGYLRRKLDVPFHVHTLQTVRGLGYRLDSDKTLALHS